MEIKYLGYSCFRIKGKQMVVLTDLLDDSSGLKLPSGSTSDLVISSSPANEQKIKAMIKPVKREETFVIDRPGEYEVGGLFILGIGFKSKITVYVVTIDDLKIGFLGGLTDKLSDKQLEELDGVDILLLPVGGKPYIDSKQANFLIDKIQPSFVIPMVYKMPGLKIDLEAVDEFLKEVGAQATKAIDKLLVSKESLPLEREIVVLNAKG